MKFQIILEAMDKKTCLMSSDDFEKLVQRLLKGSLLFKNFKLIGARPLEGIQAKSWEPARIPWGKKDLLD